MDKLNHLLDLVIYQNTIKSYLLAFLALLGIVFAYPTQKLYVKQEA